MKCVVPHSWNMAAWFLGLMMIVDLAANGAAVWYRGESFSRFKFDDSCLDLALASALRILVLAFGMLVLGCWGGALFDSAVSAKAPDREEPLFVRGSMASVSSGLPRISMPSVANADAKICGGPSEPLLHSKKEGPEEPQSHQEQHEQLDAAIASRMTLVWSCCVGETEHFIQFFICLLIVLCNFIRSPVCIGYQ